MSRTEWIVEGLAVLAMAAFLVWAEIGHAKHVKWLNKQTPEFQKKWREAFDKAGEREDLFTEE